ncbi:MAG: 50S ribosome-binding GTPase [Nanoarchaeota archaeon]|nr:50S ribosome-binding GTPase [Nanoarchaeota archaeon]
MRIKFAYSSKFTQKFRKPPTTNKHSVAFTSMAQDIIDKSNVVLEVLDARFVDKTRNEELEKEVKKKDKKLIFVLNKADLIDINDLKFSYDLTQLEPYVLFSSKNRVGRARLREIILIEAKKSKAKRVMIGVIGYPNTGKSSLINVLCGGKRAGTSPHAGFTKNIQKVRFRDNVYILDSPGVITGGEENSINERIVKKQIEIGAKDYNKAKYPDLTLNEIMKEAPKIFDEFYGVKSRGEIDVLLEKLGKKWNFLKKGGEVDTERTARRILRDWQEGKVVLKKR